MNKELMEICLNYEESKEEEQIDKLIEEFLYAMGNIEKRFCSNEFAYQIQEAVDHCIEEIK
jgi:hypothetical protein